MATHSLTLFCYRCEGNTGHTQPAANHTLHLILTLCTSGIWGLVWLYVAVSSMRPATCSRCGAEYDQGRAGEVAWRLDYARQTGMAARAGTSYQPGAYNPFPFSLPPQQRTARG